MVIENSALLQSLQHMMAQSTPFMVLVAALLTTTLSYCSAENVYCVTPTTTSCSSCPHNIHCTTLSEYAQEAEVYFTSNTTMVFLPGDHVLNANITTSNATRLTMRGESSSGNRATIVCSGSVGLSFTSMVDLEIDSLAFTSCSRKSHGTYLIGNYTLLLHSTQSAALVNCSFHDNLSTALVVNNTNITLSGNKFMHNRSYKGGGITALSSNLTFTGNTTFLDNSALRYGPFICCRGPGGAISAFYNTVLSFSGNSSFINNSASVGHGGAIYASDIIGLSFNGTNNFISNSAGEGGAISASGNASISFNGTSNFIYNSANWNGGVIYTSNNTVLTFSGTTNFTNNSAYGEGGAIFTLYNTRLSFTGTNNFINNLGDTGNGGAINTRYNVVLSFSGTNNFINNSVASVGGAMFAHNTQHSLNGTSTFLNNYAVRGGAIQAESNSTMAFSGTIHFTNNGGKMSGHSTSGGGVYMELKSTISFLPNTTVYWENNQATLGGAIYVRDASSMSYCTPVAKLVPQEKCFFQLPGQNLSNDINVHLVFKNNSADIAGSMLYGGAIDNCKLTHGLDSYSSGKVFDMIVHNNHTDYNTNSNSNISSHPFYMCICTNNHQNECSISMKQWYGIIYDFPRSVYPGETIQLSVVPVGQRNGTVRSIVRSSISYVNSGFQNANAKPTGAHLQDSQYLQQAHNTCTELNYTVFSLHQKVFIKLQPGGSPCSDVIHTVIAVNLSQTCPPGFNISKSNKSCVCEPRLAKYTNNCTISNGVGRITHNSNQHFWVGYDNQSHELILHPHCPLDYCVNDTVVFPLNNTDKQCAYNRSGLLCGACKKGYSMVLGTSQCWKCTNNYLLLLIAFAVMGVALVLFLFVCKLTVATGTLSGLLFYANIVGVNRTIFLPVESTNLFSLFIAWLNLDFGIETCFYNGMDAYSKTWLQFVFPVYIWVLVGLMILVSHFSKRFARLLGNNPVSILATLILLSYTKILRTLIAVLYVTFLEYSKHNRMVWLYDANIDYLSDEHTPLFVVAVLIFLFLFLPYTLLFLFGQWLQAISHLWLFSWVNSTRLKAFMDSYHAPYKAKHRYWPGLLLVLRFVLLLVFALNPQEEHSINLLSILVTTGLLVAWAWLGGGIYRNWCLDALECSFALNLIILAAATYHVNLSGGNQLAVGYTSISIAFATFIGIFIFQLANVTGITQHLKRKFAALKVATMNQNEAKAELRSPTDPLPDRLLNPDDYEPSLYTPQQHATAEPTERANEAQRRLITPVYTYGSIN